MWMELLIWIGCIGVLVLAVLLFRQKKNHQANLILGIWVLLIPVPFLFRAGVLGDIVPISRELNWVGFTVILLLAPVLFLYVRALTKPTTLLGWIDGLHLMPAIIYVSAHTYWESYPNVYRWIAFSIQAFIYTAVASYLLYQHQKTIRNYFSNLSPVNLRWVQILIIMLLGIGFLRSFESTMHFSESSWNVYLLMIEYVSVLFIAYLISIKSLRQCELTRPSGHINGYKHKMNVQHGMVHKKYSPELQKVIQKMEIEKPFLQPDLTISEVSDSTTIPVAKLTHLLTSELHQDFYHFVNEFRVEEAKRLLLSSNGHGTMDLKEISLKAGFSSVDMFVHTFKAHTGQDPRTFYQQLEMEYA